jgi:hypothetical protein
MEIRLISSKLTKTLNKKTKDILEDYVENYLKPVTPVKTGALKASWTIVKEDDKYIVATDKEYAVHVEFGSSTIRPRGFIRSSYADWLDKTQR